MSFRDVTRIIKSKAGTMKKDQYLILLLTGVLLLVIAIPTKTDKTKADKKEEALQSEAEATTEEYHLYSQEDIEEAYTAMLEQKLEQGLTYVAGAGRVKVMITLKSGAEHVILKDISDNGVNTVEKDAGGGNRTVIENETVETTIYTENAEGGTTPYVYKDIPPKVEGVTVICEGGANSVVRSDITDVVKALFPIDVHKIKVVRMAVTKTNSGKETIER